ncbi:MAG: sporulation-delaying protein SdpB family protein [Saprospiraceae bacterium]
MIQFYKNFYHASSDFLFQRNPYTWVYGLARTILALGTLITLSCSSVKVLFDETIFQQVNAKHLFSNINYFQLFGWENLALAKGLAIVLLLITASGIYPRITGIFQWWIASSFFYASTIIEGGDQINSIICLLFIPITLLDNRRWHWSSTGSSENKNFIGNLMFLLISIQMAMIYLNAVTDKVYAGTEEWKLGNAIYYYLNDAYFSYPDWMDPLMTNLLANSFVVSSVTWGTMFLELILFGVLFSTKKIKFALFPFAVIFHLGIAVFLGLISFFMAMTAGLLIYLVPKDLSWPPKYQSNQLPTHQPEQP